MALTQAQRIEISKKVIDIPRLNAALDNVKSTIDSEKVKITNEDNANKSLMDDVTALINPYQQEYGKLDGNVRTELLEQDMIDGANKKKQNFFFPNDNAVPLPNVPDGIWKFFAPFSGSLAIGKNYTEGYSTQTSESTLISNINAQIAVIEAESAASRSTGKKCEEDLTGTCSDPLYTDQATCEGNGETWTPNNGPDTYSDYDVIQDALTAIVAAVNAWRTNIQEQKTIIQSENAVDIDATRVSENNTAIGDIDNATSVIDGWLAYDNFDTTTTLPSGSGGSACAAFDALTANDFQSSKLRSIELQEIKDEITARLSFIATRQTQLNGYLGSAGQDLSTGDLNELGSGFYDKRYKIINIRLNLLGGSLNKKISLDKGSEAQDAIKATNNNAASLYNDVMKASKFKAPASNIGVVHVEDGSLFSPSDAVYIVADNQPELSGNISNIDGNTITVDFNVPQKYDQNNAARIYKIL